MHLNAKYIIFVFLIAQVLFASVYIFSKGFLLTRNEVPGRSFCNDFNLGNYKGENGGCWMPKKYKKIVIMIIDGLRFDFAYYNTSLDHDNSMHLNKMKTFHKLINSGQQNAFLRPFIADAPTTTMQRIKGLTTGSLPTFIDASLNFASEEILEDNLIDQLKVNGVKIVALGDDTWGGLFPGRFHRSLLYDSFNVKDLDTVDNGVQAQMMVELEKPDWDVCILHFLGVDHAGHTFGLHHLRMKEKLWQMDKIVSDLASFIDDDTLLLVMGDHGMTTAGDHGGASNAEITSAFFAYSSKLKVFESEIPISQIDLVPTLSLLLGVPIPFSNIGMIIKDFFTSDLTNALELNVKQVSRYLEFYQQKYMEFPHKEWHDLSSLFSRMPNAEGEAFNKLSFSYLHLAKMICEDAWARFDDSLMISGTVSLFCGILVALSVSLSKGNLIRLLGYSIVLIICCFLTQSPLLSIFTTITSIITLFTLSKRFTVYHRSTLLSSMVIVFLFLFSITSFSNSYVVVENYLASFILSSVFFFKSFYLLANKYKFWLRMKSKPHMFGHYEIVICSSLFVAFLSIRLSSIFWRCREEQFWCRVTPEIHTSIGGLPSESCNLRFFMSLTFLILIVYMSRKWLSYCGNLNGVVPSVLIVRFMPNLNVLLIASFWALEGVKMQSENITLVSVYIPRLVYGLTFLSLSYLFYDPLLIYILPRDLDSSSKPDPNSESAIPHYFMKLKFQYSRRLEASPPIVYGLATAISSTIIFSIIQILMVIILITGDGMIISILLLILAAICALILTGLLSWKSFEYSNAMLIQPDIACIFLWFLLSFHGFYSTGHLSTFSSIDWMAAFVGYNDAKAHWFPALLILLNTFSSHLLFGLSLPLVYIIHFTMGVLWPSLLMNTNSREEVKRGEFILVERSKQARDALTSTALIYLALHATKVFFTAIASVILKRHLMAWKIFAPHFVFELVGFGITCISVLFGQLLVLRTLSALESWSSQLCDKGE